MIPTLSHNHPLTSWVGATLDLVVGIGRLSGDKDSCLLNTRNTVLDGELGFFCPLFLQT